MPPWIFWRGADLLVEMTYSLGGEQITDTLNLLSRGEQPKPRGTRHYWWGCVCGLRVGVLYNPSGRWRCRHCGKITYSSSNASDKRISALIAAGLPAYLAPKSFPEFEPGMDEAALRRNLREVRQFLFLNRAYCVQEERLERQERREQRKGQRRE